MEHAETHQLRPGPCRSSLAARHLSFLSVQKDSFVCGGVDDKSDRLANRGSRGECLEGQRSTPGCDGGLLGLERSMPRAARPSEPTATRWAFRKGEIIKARANAGGRRQLFYFRGQQGLEVDFVVPGKQGSVSLIEVKATRSVKPAMAQPLLRLAAAWEARSGRGMVEKAVVHREGRGTPVTTALAPGVRAITISDFVAEASQPHRAKTRSTAWRAE
jgi:hypothetical protein